VLQTARYHFNISINSYRRFVAPMHGLLTCYRLRCRKKKVWFGFGTNTFFRHPASIRVRLLGMERIKHASSIGRVFSFLNLRIFQKVSNQMFFSMKHFYKRYPSMH